MIVSSLVERRLLSQRLLSPRSKNPTDVVQWLAAVQAQDYAGAKWGLGMRLPGSTDADVERAFDRGAILRTHLLRPTWHFVAPKDIRWLLALTRPRVHAASGHMYRRLALDATIFQRSHTAFARALEDDNHLTRDELRAVLERLGIATELERMAYLLMHAELEGLICSGPRRGKQFTYALLDERVPATPERTRAAALHELARRFYTSRGPATVHDFAKWSGLTLAEARHGLEAAMPSLESEVIDGKTYWFSAPPTRRELRRSPIAHLISIYDEYISGYRDRTAIITAGHAARLRRSGNAATSVVAVNGRIVGLWRRTFRRRGVDVRVKLFKRITPAEQRAVQTAVTQYCSFIELPLVR